MKNTVLDADSTFCSAPHKLVIAEKPSVARRITSGGQIPHPLYKQAETWYNEKGR